MSNAGVIAEKPWKDVVLKFKVKDNGLQKALAAYDKMEEDDHDGCLKTIGVINQIANNLKKAKELSAVEAAQDFLKDLLGAIPTELRELQKAKADAAKAAATAQKQAADAQKKQDADSSEEEEEEEEQGEHRDKLINCFKKLKSSKELEYHFAVCDAKPYFGIVISKQAIMAKHKMELTKISGGSKRYLKPGKVRVESGKLVFDMDDPPAGLAAKLKKSFKYFTGLNIGVMVGDQSDEDEEESGETEEKPEARGQDAAKEPEVGHKPEPSGEEGVKTPESKAPGAPAEAKEPGIQEAKGPAGGAGPAAEDAAKGASKVLKILGSVGRKGKNKPEDVQAVQAALNERAKAGLEVDGKCGSKTIDAIKKFQAGLGMPYPDGLVEPGNLTEKALNGEKIVIPERPKTAKPAEGGKATPGGGVGGAAKAGAVGAAAGAGKGAAAGGGGFFGPGMAEAFKKLAQEAADRKKRAEQLYKDAIAKLNEAAKAGGGQVVDEKYREELQKAYDANQEHESTIAKWIREAVKAQDEAKAKAAQDMADGARKVFQTLEGAVGQILRIL